MANEKIGLSAVFDVDQYNAGVNTYIRGLADAEAKTNSAASAISQAGSSISAGFGAALGIIAVDAIKSFVGEAVGAIGSALSLASAFEQLEFGIRALGAAQDLIAGSDQTFGELFTASEDAAKGYLLLLQDIAIPSIFTTQQLAEVMRGLQVFGFMQDEALRLTELLTNMATAGNIPSEMLNRLAYAMGQVATEGRLLATEVRQFANAGVPILAILAEKLDKNSMEIREMMKEGLLTADVVFPILVEYLENFEGVTGEAQRTLRGLFSALQDVKEISTSNFMQELLAPVMPLLESIVRFFTGEDILAGAAALGKMLGPTLAQFIADGVRAVMSLVETLTTLDPAIIETVALFAGGVIVATAFGAALGIISLAIGLLVGPFTLAVAAVASFITAYATNFGNIATITNTVVGFVGRAIEEGINWFGRFATGIGDALSEASAYMGDFLGEVADWGINIVQTLADGISSAVGLVFDALSVLGSAISYLLSPGSPPRLLPDLTTWGKGAASAWLEGWTDADFGILSDIGNFVEQALKFSEGKGRGDTSTTSLIQTTNYAIAQAIDSIREYGEVSQETYDAIRESAGSASDEIIGYIERYQALALATNLVEDAQTRLNDVTEAYDKLLAPLQDKLAAATEAGTLAKESLEIKGLERLLAQSGVSDARKAEALARLEQITARQKIAALETERDAVTDKIQVELDAATKVQDAAQTELDLFQKRLNLQNEYLGQIQKEADALKNASEAREKALKKELTPLEQQLKLIQLQQEEMADLIKEAKARKVLEDETATAAQKMTAQLELQEIATRRQLRDIEAAKLGGNLAALREIAIVAADLEKPLKGGGKLDGISGAVEILTDSDPLARLEAFKLKVDELYASFETLGTNIETAARKANENLPAFLQFLNPPGVEGPGPLWGHLGEVLAGFASFKFAEVTAGLLGLGPAGVAAAAGIGLFVAAYAGDWGGLQAKVGVAVDFITAKLKELSESEFYKTIKTNLENIYKDLTGPDSVILAEVQAQIDLVFGDFTFTDLPKALENLQTSVGDVLKGLDWENITPDTFYNLISAIPEAIEAAIGGLSDSFGQGVDFVQANFPEINFAAISAGIGKAIASLIVNAFTGMDVVINELLESALHLTSASEKGGDKSVVREAVSALTQILLGAVAGIIIGAFEMLKPENLLIYLKTVGNLIWFLGNLLDDVFTGIFDGVQETIEQLFAKKVVETINTIFAHINSVIQQINEQTAKLGLTPITEFDKIAVPLRADQFEVITQDKVKIDLSAGGGFLELTGKQLLDSAELFEINGETKVSLPAAAVFAINPGLREVVAPGDLIEVDGAQRILLTPLQLAALESGSPIQYAPGEVFSLDLTKPIVAQIPITPNIQIDEVFTSISDHLRTEGALQTAAREAATTFATAFGQTVIGPPKINTGDATLNAAGAAAGLQFVQGFSELPPEIQKKLIQQILTLPVDEGAALIKAGFDTKNQFISGTGVTEEDLLAAKTQYKDLGGAMTDGMIEGAKLDEQRRKSFHDIILDVNDAMMQAAEAESPSGLTKRTVGKSLGEGVLVGAQEELAKFKSILELALAPALTYVKTALTQNALDIATAVGLTHTVFRTNVLATLTLMEEDATTFRTNETLAWDLYSIALTNRYIKLYLDIDTATIAFVALVEEHYKGLQTNVESTVTSTSTNVQGLFSALHTKVGEKLSAIITTINEKLAELVADLEENFVKKGEELGEDFGAGIEAGILNYAEEISKAAVKVVQDALTASQDELDAHSPSGEASKKLGEPFGAGTAQGILDTIPIVTAAASRMVEGMLASASQTLYESTANRFGQSAGTTVNNINHYHLNVQSERPSSGIVYDFEIMEIMK